MHDDDDDVRNAAYFYSLFRTLWRGIVAMAGKEDGRPNRAWHLDRRLASRNEIPILRALRFLGVVVGRPVGRRPMDRKICDVMRMAATSESQSLVNSPIIIVIICTMHRRSLNCFHDIPNRQKCYCTFNLQPTLMLTYPEYRPVIDGTAAMCH